MDPIAVNNTAKVDGKGDRYDGRIDGHTVLLERGYNAGIAQLGEQQTEVLEVACSIHAPGIDFYGVEHDFSLPTTVTCWAFITLVILV